MIAEARVRQAPRGELIYIGGKEAALENLFDLSGLQATMSEMGRWFSDNILVPGSLWQTIYILAAFVVAALGAPKLRSWLKERNQGDWSDSQYRGFIEACLDLMLPAIWMVLSWVALMVLSQSAMPLQLIKAAVSLLTAWVVIRLFSALIRDPGWSRLIAISAWTIAALNIVNLLTPTVALMDSIALNLGDLRVSLLGVFKGVVILAFLLWLASLASQLLERRIKAMPNLTPSVQVLFSKLLKITLITIAFVAALNSIGIDLTAFAVFSGAVGLGIGFGLQKVVSNLLSGVILLLDRSVKPGDVIVVGETYGWINSLGARYVSVVTRDGIEHLIPNEELIGNRVENWSYSNTLVRLRIGVGVSYGSDLRKARELALEAATVPPRVLADPAPTCLLMGFGDSSVDLELRAWIRDPQNGVSNIKSEIRFAIWDKFKDGGIEFPFPQRDVHLSADAPVPVRLQPETE